jgi:hypothetical protein
MLCKSTPESETVHSLRKMVHCELSGALKQRMIVMMRVMVVQVRQSVWRKHLG